MLEDMQVRNFSAHTKGTYLRQVSRFARHFGRSPAELGPDHIRAYQLYLTNERRLSTSTVVSAVSALRFFYRVTLNGRRRRQSADGAAHRAEQGAAGSVRDALPAPVGDLAGVVEAAPPPALAVSRG
jgi:site-specific recombinase XerD